MKKNLLSKFSVMLLLLGLGGCSEQSANHENTIYVSISPIKQIAQLIVGSDFDIKVMVPAGGSPETFEPTPKQYIALNEARAVMSIGLIDFEMSLLSRIENQDRLVNLSAGVETLEGSCSHNHHGEHHHHGVDPHIWTSPKELQRMAENCYNAIAKLYPDSLQYGQNYEALKISLDELDAKVAEAIATSGIKSFVIHHPAYSYYARDYGIEQVAIEEDGKDPSTRRIGEIIDRAREEGVTQILYQNQFPSTVVDVIAKDAGAAAISVDPLSEDIIAHIEEFTTIITRKR
ncbi:MAG: zinc ABC transporter substrate-binding protein [Rikenellaceae bacterium]